MTPSNRVRRKGQQSERAAQAATGMRSRTGTLNDNSTCTSTPTARGCGGFGWCSRTGHYTRGRAIRKSLRLLRECNPVPASGGASHRGEWGHDHELGLDLPGVLKGAAGISRNGGVLSNFHRVRRIFIGRRRCSGCGCMVPYHAWDGAWPIRAARSPMNVRVARPRRPARRGHLPTVTREPRVIHSSMKVQ